MDDDLDEVLALKASAKSARDEGDWAGSIDELDEAIQIIQDLVPGASKGSVTVLVSELADSYGMIGGVQRRWALELEGKDRLAHLEESVDAYDEGFRFEQQLGPNEASTYNRINRLIGRVLLDPTVLQADGGGATTADVLGELGKAEQIVREQVETARQKDPWGYCDLGTIRLLRGTADALLTFHELDRLRPPAFVYESALATLEPLSEAASEIRPDLRRAVEQLQRSLRYAL